MPYFYDALNGNDITASRITAEVTNADSVTLVRGDVVYLFGATGNRASVKLASAVGDITSSTTFGIVEDTIAPNNIGTIVNQGVIDGLNLGAYSPGDSIWLSTTAGDFTNVKPVAPTHTVFLGVVERANNGNGQIYVKVQNGYELGELHNVLTNGATTGQVLTYDGATSLWTHKSTDYDPMLSALGMSSLTPETMPRTAAAAAGNTVSGEVHLSFFTAAQTKTVSNISMVTSGTAAATVTTIRLGLYTVDGSGNVTLVARTANDTTLFNATNATFTRPFNTTGGFPSSYELVAGTRYAVGFIVVATTRPSLYHCPTQNAAITSLAPRMAAVLASQTDLPTTINTVGGASPAYADVNRQYYARLS
jgi:hypothetical protein